MTTTEELIDTPDGGAIVVTPGKPPGQADDFYANIVKKLDDGQLSTFANNLLELIGKDKEARRKRDEQYAEAIRRTGLGDDAPGGAQFAGASKVVHPMLTEAAVDFASRAMKEMFPATGPVKDMIVGEPTRDKVERARRKTKHMNWQLTVQMKEFRSELEQLLTQLPLGGGQYMKLGWDGRKKRPTSMFVPIDDMLIPFAASGFYSAERKTHEQRITAEEYERRVHSGMYFDVDGSIAIDDDQGKHGGGSVAIPDETAAAVATNKIEGRSATTYNEDGLRLVHEVYLEADLEDDDDRPYIVSIDDSTGDVLSVYRNWIEGDKHHEELTWIVEFAFVPWRGAYPIGLGHMIGGLSAAATGALRALLDSAHINNFPGLLKLKGGSKGGQSQSISPTEIKEIEGGLNVDDVRKLAMPLPFNPPSPVLFQLLGFLVEAGKGVVRTTFENLSDGANPNMPVGTTLQLIEQGGTVFSAIHARLHASMQRVLDVLHRVNELYLDDGDLKNETGEVLARRDDYGAPMDVVPISDPNIFSETQRYAQVQAIAQRAAGNPLYDQREVEMRILERLKIPDAEKLLVKTGNPKRMNAANENLAACMGRPLLAFPEQDHLAHIQVHLDFMQSPFLGMSRLIAPQFLPKMLDHLREHVALWYVVEMYRKLSEASGVPAERLMHDDMIEEFDQLTALASQIVTVKAASEFKTLPPIIDAAVKMMQSLMPPMPTDPSIVAQQAAAAETQRKTQADSAKVQADAQRLQFEQQKLQLAAPAAQLEQQKVQADIEAEAAKLALEMKMAEADAQLDADRIAATREATAARTGMNAEDNRTAMTIAAAEIEMGNKTGLSTGTGINP